jgi:hypothetical protein
MNTPRTDAAIKEVDVAFDGADGLSSSPEKFIDPDFARMLEKENAEFRCMLAVCHTGMKGLYYDDGELQDSSSMPMIDWKRDSLETLQRKLMERAINALKGMKP